MNNHKHTRDELRVEVDKQRARAEFAEQACKDTHKRLVADNTTLRAECERLRGLVLDHEIALADRDSHIDLLRAALLQLQFKEYQQSRYCEMARAALARVEGGK